MKLGLLADIHEHNEHLAVALKVFHQQGVRQVVVLGDIFETGQRIDATVGLLAESHAIGVWGNHDFPFCHAPGQLLRERYSTRFLDFMGRLQPRLEIAGCLFSHVEPWLNPEELADLWYLDGPPDTTEKLTRTFEAVPHSIVFIGHFHRWLIATPEGILDWHGDSPIQLSPAVRYLIVVGANCDGWYGIFDTLTRMLIPFRQSGLLQDRAAGIA